MNPNRDFSQSQYLDVPILHFFPPEHATFLKYPWYQATKSSIEITMMCTRISHCTRLCARKLLETVYLRRFRDESHPSFHPQRLLHVPGNARKVCVHIVYRCRWRLINGVMNFLTSMYPKTRCNYSQLSIGTALQGSLFMVSSSPCFLLECWAVQIGPLYQSPVILYPWEEGTVTQLMENMYGNFAARRPFPSTG